MCDVTGKHLSEAQSDYCALVAGSGDMVSPSLPRLVPPCFQLMVGKDVKFNPPANKKLVA